jgi:hypothetical protein
MLGPFSETYILTYIRIQKKILDKNAVVKISRICYRLSRTSCNFVKRRQQEAMKILIGNLTIDINMPMAISFVNSSETLSHSRLRDRMIVIDTLLICQI